MLTNDPYTETGYDISVTSTTSSTAPSPTDLTATERGYEIPYTYSTRPNSYFENGLEELIREQIITRMIDSWYIKNDKIKTHKRRPDLQLRGVCLNGLGWA